MSDSFYKRLMTWIVGRDARIIGFDLLSQRRKRFLPLFLSGAAETLDVGCGGGPWAVIAAQRGNRVLAITPLEDEAAIAEALARLHGVSRQVEVRRMDGREIGALGRAFDQILCFEVLEHILDDRQVVANLRAALKAGGQVLISVPTREHRRLWGESISEVEDGPSHVRWGYSPDDLRALLGPAGFEIVQMEGYGGFFTQGLTSLMRWLRDRWGLDAAITFPLCYPLLALDPLIPYPPLSYFVVAR